MPAGRWPSRSPSRPKSARSTASTRSTRSRRSPRRHGLPLHMDGARFANALVALDTTPAEMTWKRGVDILSFGGTKNGCWCAEAVVLFDPAQAARIRPSSASAPRSSSPSRASSRRSSRPISRTGCGWRRPRHANAMAARLAGHIRASKKVRLAWEPQANEVFAVMTRPNVEALQEKGARSTTGTRRTASAAMSAPGEMLCRFVTSFATTARRGRRASASADRAKTRACAAVRPQQKKAAPEGAASVDQTETLRLRRPWPRSAWRCSAPAGDRDLARLQLFRDVALQVDVKQAVLQRGAGRLRHGRQAGSGARRRARRCRDRAPRSLRHCLSSLRSPLTVSTLRCASIEISSPRSRRPPSRCGRHPRRSARCCRADRSGRCRAARANRACVNSRSKPTVER